MFYEDANISYSKGRGHNLTFKRHLHGDGKNFTTMTFHGYVLSVYHMLALSLNVGLDVGLERTKRKTQCLIQVGVRYRGYRVSVCST